MQKVPISTAGRVIAGLASVTYAGIAIVGFFLREWVLGPLFSLMAALEAYRALTGHDWTSGRTRRQDPPKT
jgi:hypothetical protein